MKGKTENEPSMNMFSSRDRKVEVVSKLFQYGGLPGQWKNHWLTDTAQTFVSNYTIEQAMIMRISELEYWGWVISAAQEKTK